MVLVAHQGEISHRSDEKISRLKIFKEGVSMRTKHLVKGAVYLCTVFSLVSAFQQQAHANNPSVAAGNVGYVTHNPWLGFWMRGGYVTTMQGPGNFGWSFMHLRVMQISVMPTNFDEQFELLDRDQLKIAFQVHFTLRADAKRIREVVEEYNGNAWYDQVVQKPLQSIVRDAVGNVDSSQFISNQKHIEATILEQARQFLVGKPFYVDKVSIGNLKYPEAVTAAAAARQAAQQTLAQRELEIQTAEKNALIRAAEADGIRKAQEIINATLTPIYVQHEFIQAMRDIASKPGNTVIYVPLGTNGLPMITDPSNHVTMQRGPGQAVVPVGTRQ